MLRRPLSLPEISELLRDGFNETIARDLYAQGEEVVVWVMLQLAVLAQQRSNQSCEVSPSTPSGAIPVYQKEPSKKHRDELLTFLYYDDVPFDNNHTERIIRVGVIKRKNSYCNRIKSGTETQAMLMSIFQTLKQKQVNLVNSLVKAIKEYQKTKKLPKIQKK
jgi:hypothetical protein